MNEPISLAKRSGSNRHWTPLQMLESKLEQIRSGELNPGGAVLLLVNDPENLRVDLSVGTANLNRLEVVGALDVARSMYSWDMILHDAET